MKHTLVQDLNRTHIRAVLQEFLDLYVAGKYRGISKMEEIFLAISTPPITEPPIPWDLIDEKYRFCTISDVGVWWVHTGRPQVVTTQWTTSFADTVMLPAPRNHSLARHWQEILLERPPT